MGIVDGPFITVEFHGDQAARCSIRNKPLMAHVLSIALAFVLSTFYYWTGVAFFGVLGAALCGTFLALAFQATLLPPELPTASRFFPGERVRVVKRGNNTVYWSDAPVTKQTYDGTVLGLVEKTGDWSILLDTPPSEGESCVQKFPPGSLLSTWEISHPTYAHDKWTYRLESLKFLFHEDRLSQPDPASCRVFRYAVLRGLLLQICRVERSWEQGPEEERMDRCGGQQVHQERADPCVDVDRHHPKAFFWHPAVRRCIKLAVAARMREMPKAGKTASSTTGNSCTSSKFQRILGWCSLILLTSLMIFSINREGIAQMNAESQEQIENEKIAQLRAKLEETAF